MKFSTEKLIKLWHTRWPFGAVAAFVAAVLALILSPLSTFESLEYKTYDARFALRGPIEPEGDDIVVVAIDDDTFSGLDMTWPFPRVLFAKAILNLYEAGAKLIVVDIEFTESNQNEPRQDLILAGAIKRAGNVILAGQIVTQHFRNDIVNTYLEKPIDLLMESGAAWGTIGVDEDTDGFIRRYLLFQTLNKKAYFPISVVAYTSLRKSGNGTQRVVYDDDGYFILGNRRIPKKDYNSMLINFRGPAKTYPTYSLTAVLDDQDYQLPNRDEDTDIFEIHRMEGTFKDKIVFIGASAETLQDNKFAPFFSYQGKKRKLPGVELHANALSTLMHGDAIAPQSTWSMIVMVFLLSAAAMVATKWLKPFRGMFVVIGLILFYVVIAVYAFINHQLWIQLTTPMLAIVLSFVGNVLHQTLTEQRERIRIKKSWQQYMSKDVIDSMLEKGDLPKFGGERRELTVLFSDIRGFTTFTESHSSNEVVQKLNEYLTEMVDVIFKNFGTLDKFVGDEIMAVYGAPHYYRDHAKKACNTAIEMVERLRYLQRTWSSQKQDYFQIGIGINSGKMISGNLGSSQLFDYTVIGDDVNLGARLEGANKQYGTTIIISESTYKYVRKSAVVRELDSVRVKGKNRPVKIYELRGMSEIPAIEYDLIIGAYTEGLNYYKQQKWYQALTQFKRVLHYFPTDGPTRVYIQRCLDFMENPPAQTWDGVYEFTTK